MHLASIVSERFGFKLPSPYVRMAEAGLLFPKGGSPKKAPPKKDDEIDEKPVKVRYTRARALAACDLSWLVTEEIAARLDRARPRWPSNFVFVPFAERHSGDEWGWAPSLGEPGASEPPILFIPRDSEDMRIAAPTFSSFLFRMTLESLAETPHDPATMELGERIAMLRGSARVVLDFLPAELSARLDRVLELPIRKVTIRTLRERNGKFYRTSDATHLSLVGTDWAARIIREELEDPRVDQPLRID